MQRMTQPRADPRVQKINNNDVIAQGDMQRLFMEENDGYH